MDYVNLRSAAVLTAIKSYYSDSSKKFLALMDLMMIPSDPQRIIAARASVVSSRKSARQENEEKKQNKTHMAKSKIQNKVKKNIADRVSFPSTPTRGQALQIIHLGLVQINLKILYIFLSCIIFRSNTIMYWFLESLSVPTYRATFDLVDFRTSQKIQAEVTRKRTKMTMIARSYERRIRSGGVTRTGQARLQHRVRTQ